MTHRRGTPEIAPSPGGIRAPSNTCFLGLTPVHTLNDSGLDRFSHFVGFTVVSNRQADHATSVPIGPIFAFRACDAA